MKLLVGLALIVSLGVFAGGCSTARVHSDQVRGVDFKAYKTYAWLPNSKDTTNGSVLYNEITYQNIRAAADREMAKRGYTMDAQNPDLLLLVHTTFEERQDLVSRPAYSSYNYYYSGFYPGPWYPYYYTGYYTMPYIGGYDIQQINYTEGTVIIDAIDRKNSQLIWRGWTEERLYDDKDVKELYENVDNIYKEFPVKERKDS